MRTPLAVMGAAVAALVLVAWLQYDWIGRVSESENQRIRTRLNASVEGFSRQFDQEVRRAVEAVAAGPSLSDEELKLAADHYARWRESAADRGLVKDVYAIRWREGAELEILRCDAAARAFVPAPWPREWDSLRERLETRRGGEAGGGPGGPMLDAEIAALIVARARPPWPGPRGGREGMPRPWPGGRPRGPGGVVVVALDVDFLHRKLLPAMVASYFPRDSAIDYEVRVVGAARPDEVIYQSDPHLDASFFEKPDATGMLMAMPGRPGMRRGGPEGPEDGQVGRWRLLVRNRSGSLERVVAQARWRNLAISFAVLLLMATAMAVLLVSTRRAHRLAERQLEFVAGVSHELRTPLAVICSAADNLADGLIGNEQQARRYGGVIRGEGRRLARMVEQILGFAGIQSGRARYQFEAVDVAALIEDAVAACEVETGAAGCRVETEVAPELPPVLADATALTHCLRNLLENAAVHGGPGGWIGVRAGAVNGKVEIAVEDHGAGIEPVDLAHVFEPFYRGRRAVRDQRRGFGLGLALARRIVDAHSGDIEARSSPGKGTTVTLRIPVAKIAEENNGRAQGPVD